MRSVILLCVALSGALFVSSALAGSPTRDRVPIGTVLAVIPTESACPAASAGVRITDVGGNLTFTTFVTQGIVSVVPQGSGFEVRAAGTPLWVFYPGDAGPRGHHDRPDVPVHGLELGDARRLPDKPLLRVGRSGSGCLRDDCLIRPVSTREFVAAASAPANYAFRPGASRSGPKSRSGAPIRFSPRLGPRSRLGARLR